MGGRAPFLNCWRMSCIASASPDKATSGRGPTATPAQELLMAHPTPAVQRDLSFHLHPATNLRTVHTEGPLVIARGEGVYVYDEGGRRYLEGMAGLWCASLGFSERRLAEAAYAQLRELPFYHSFG